MTTTMETPRAARPEWNPRWLTWARVHEGLTVPQVAERASVDVAAVNAAERTGDGTSDEETAIRLALDPESIIETFRDEWGKPASEAARARLRAILCVKGIDLAELAASVHETSR